MKSPKCTKSPGKSHSTPKRTQRITNGTPSTNAPRRQPSTKSLLRTTNANPTMQNASLSASTLQNIIHCLSVSLALLELSKSSIGLSDLSQLSYDKCSRLLADIARTSSCKLSEMQEALSITRICLDDFSIGLTGRNSSRSSPVLKIQGLSLNTLTNCNMSTSSKEGVNK